MSGAAAQVTALRPISLEIDGFRGWSAGVEFDLSAPLTLLIGGNAAGKSSTLNAIEWCLYGSIIAKKASGIDERADWAVVAREGAREARVALRMQSAEGIVRLERRRAGDAKAREADQFQVTLPSGDVLEGEEELQSWFDHQNLPSWDDWKRAFCQHQERSRARVLDSAERSVQLGRLLGLEQYQEWNERLKSLRVNDLEKAAQHANTEIEDSLRRASERPRREADRLAEQLEQRGIARLSLGDDLVRRMQRELVVEGMRLIEVAQLSDVCEVDADDARAVVGWAQALPGCCGDARRRLAAALSADEARAGSWGIALDAQAPTERAWRDARDKRIAFEREHGDVGRLRAELESGRRDRTALDEAERRENAMLALLQQATHLHTSGAPCPVCEQQAPNLDDQLRRRADELSTAAAEQRAAQRKALDERLKVVEDKLSQAANLENAERGADDARTKLRSELAKHLPQGVESGDAGRELLDEFRRDLERRRSDLDELDRRAEDLRGAVEQLDLLLRWTAENDRAQAARGDVDELAAWAELQDALDEAAGLARDIEVLADLTREAQESRSEERVRIVNQSLGSHYARITGADEQACARILVKRTAAKLAYSLVDGDGRSVLPVLNQAALNALSLAVLFAQAEHCAREGRPAWIVLDDPDQSLDPEARRGLARALTGLAQELPVFVATFAGQLADELQSAAGVRTYQLNKSARGPRLEGASA